MLYPRDLAKRIEIFLKRREYVAIVGPRQAGKTTFLELLRTYLIKELKVKDNQINILTFEDRKILAQFEADPVSFVKSYMNNEKECFYLMLDEFQYADGGGQKLKLVYDTIKNLKIIITGSSSLDIKVEMGKYMVGRVLSFHMYPFNFGEFLEIKNRRLKELYRQNNAKVIKAILKKGPVDIKRGKDIFGGEMSALYEEFAIWGGYPAVVLSKNKEERKKVLSDIYNNYILKDIKTLLGLVTENNLFLLSQYLAAQIGNIVVYQNLGQASGLDHRNLKKHLKILDETFICREVKPFFTNRQKELSKNPKIFFNDMGFRNNLMDNMNGLEKRSDSGAVIENTVFVRLNELRGESGSINFWRTKSGGEVDFIMKIGGEPIPVEVKYSNFESEKMSKSLASFIDCFKPSRAIVLTKNYWGSTKRAKTRIFFFPACYL